MPHLVPGVLALLVAAVDVDPAIGGAVLEADPPCVLPLAIRPSIAATDRRTRCCARIAGPCVPSSTGCPSPSCLPSPGAPSTPDARTLVDIDVPEDLERG